MVSHRAGIIGDVPCGYKAEKTGFNPILNLLDSHPRKSYCLLTQAGVAQR